MRKSTLFLASMAAMVMMQTAQAADMSKVLRTAVRYPETGFDPAKVDDLYSQMILENVLDPLVSYDYLAKPAKLIPNTVDALPTISADGKVYTFKIKPGTYFSDDPAFGGKKRELVAEDYVYSFKRFLDPTINSPYSFLLDGRLVGMDEVVKAAGKGPLNYDTPVEGIKAIDKYTLRLTLKNTNHNMMQILAMPVFGAVAREVIEAYKSNTNAHPVGTGPYVLKEWKPGSKIVLEASPSYRKVVFNSQPGKDAVDAEIVKALKGKTLPIVGRIEMSVIEEEQPLWLSFANKQLDYVGVQQAVMSEVLNINPQNPTEATLSDKYAKQGIRLHRLKKMETNYYFFNMDDPQVGGSSKEKIALRRAIAMGFPNLETIATIRRGQAVPANYIVPEGVAGHNPDFRAGVKYDLAAANALLDRFGYKVGADGFRTQPNGQPLVITMGSGTGAIDKQWNEYWQKEFDALKIKLGYQHGKWNELLKASREGKLQMWGSSWFADYPDGENFMQLLYGKNSGDSNGARFKDPEYDRLFEASLKLPDGSERNKLYDEMNKIVVAQQPWIFTDTRISNIVTQPNVKGFKPHALLNAPWRYLDVQ